MKKKIVVVIVGIFLLGFMGCAPSVSYMPFKEKPVVSEERIQVLSEKPQGFYKLLGLLEVNASYWTSQDEMLRLLKRKAYLVGAEAIMDLEYEAGGEKVEPATKGYYASSSLLWPLPKRKINNLFGFVTLKAKAIRYEERR